MNNFLERIIFTQLAKHLIIETLFFFIVLCCFLLFLYCFPNYFYLCVVLFSSVLYCFLLFCIAFYCLCCFVLFWIVSYCFVVLFIVLYCVLFFFALIIRKSKTCAAKFDMIPDYTFYSKTVFFGLGKE